MSYRLMDGTGNFSNKELMEQERSFHTFSIRFPLIFQDHFSEWQLEYPFQVQAAKGGELHFGKPSVGFMWIAYQGSDLMIFQNKSWWPSPKGGRRAQQVCRLFNQYHVINVRLQAHISDTCPHFLLGLLDAGKTHLQQQGQSCSLPPRFLYSALINLHHSLKFMVRDEARGLAVYWPQSQSWPSPAGVPCLGFYSKPVWEQQGTQRGDVLPHADGTWYLQISLDVKASEAAGLSCQVRHSSLGGQDIVLYWGEKELGPSWERGWENTLETSMYWPPTGMRNHQPKDQDIPKPSSAVMSLSFPGTDRRSCDSHFGKVSEAFAQIAYQGSDLMSFQNTSWRLSPKGGSRAQQVFTLFNQYHVFNEMLYTLLSGTCPGS
ncbi:hypothetical protein GH733_010436 [Mirounga leonina]|nr:hypothetical protein GH733_010436 [Mirounga leonina]